MRILSCEQGLYIKPADYKAEQTLVSLAVLCTSSLTSYSNGCKNTRRFIYAHKILSCHMGKNIRDTNFSLSYFAKKCIHFTL